MMLSKLKRLNSEERKALLPALFRLLITRLVLFAGIRNTSRRLGGKLGSGQNDFDPALWTARAKVMQGLAARLPGMACLTQSLALRWWMRAHAHDAQMKIGVCKTAERLESHAWVELDGHSFAEKQVNIARFQVVESY